MDVAAHTRYWTVIGGGNPLLVQRRLAAHAPLDAAAFAAALATSDLRALAAINPHCPIGRLDGLLCDDDPTVRTAAAINPGAAALLDEHARTSDSIALSGLRNPEASSDYISEHFHRAPDVAIGHRNCPEQLRTDPDLAARHPRVWSNPRTDRDAALHMARHGNPSRRAAAIRHPGLTLDELIDVHHTHPTDATIRIVIEQRSYVEAPFTAPWNSQLAAMDPHPVVAEQLAALRDDTIVAAAALVANRFDGTLGELIGTAAGITGDPAPLHSTAPGEWSR
jgi:hypothetical protein